jgi:hypothetical protein
LSGIVIFVLRQRRTNGDFVSRESIMNKRKAGIVVGVLLLLVVGIVWAMRGRADAQVAKVQALGKEAFGGDGPPDPEKREQFDGEMRKLSREQRRDVMGKLMEERENRKAATFCGLPPDKQNDMLDKELREQERMRKEREARRAQQGQSPNQAGPGPGSGRGPNANAGRQRSTPEQNMQRRNGRLDKSTPEQRAQRAAYRAAMDKRRKQLGLPAGRPRLQG